MDEHGGMLRYDFSVGDTVYLIQVSKETEAITIQGERWTREVLRGRVTAAEVAAIVATSTRKGDFEFLYKTDCGEFEDVDIGDTAFHYYEDAVHSFLDWKECVEAEMRRGSLSQKYVFDTPKLGKE